MAVVYNGRGSVGEFSERGRQAVAIAHGAHKTNEGVGLLGMVGEQPDSIGHLAEASLHPFEEFPCLGRRVRIVLLQCRNSSHLQSPTVITITCLRMRAQCRVLKAPVVTPSSGVAIADRTIAALEG